jgi:hypothetical protein
MRVDGQVEERQITVIFSNFETHPDRPYMFGEQRLFLPNNAPFVPGGSTGANGG